MKKLTLAFLLLSQYCFAQQWVNMMRDPNANFYQTQKSFNDYYKQQLRHQNLWYNKVLHVFNKESEKEIPGYEVFKRWESFTEPRVYPSGRMFPGDQTWNEFYNFCNKYGINSTNVAGNWAPLGPTSWLTTSYNPGIGRVNVVFVDPNDSNTIYIGSPAGGLWKSNDAGQTWNSTTDHLPTLGVSGIAVPQGSSNIVYIGTGDGDAGDTYGVGVLKSTDGGATWNSTGLSWAKSQTRSVTKLLIDPTDTSIIFATTNSGIFKSVDAGLNWIQVQTGSFRDIEFQPGNSNIVYASGTIFVRSSDGGNTFTQITAGLPASANVNHLAIGVTPDDSSYVYLASGASSNSGFYGLFRSTDGGISFTLRSSTPNLYGYDMNGTDVGGQSWYSMTVSVSPDNKNEVYTGGVNIWKSDNGGSNWNIITHWAYDVSGPYPYVHADQHAMDFFGNKLYVGCDGGVFNSNDYGVSWNDISAGTEISEFYRLGASSTDPTKIMAGAQDNGCNFYENGQWTHVLGADGMETAIDPVNSNTLYACGQGGWLNRSDDGGLTMNTISTSAMGNGNWVTPYMLDPNDHNTIYAGYGELWKSNNQGNTWNAISSFAASASISTFNISPSNSDEIFVLLDNTLYLTTDGGLNWSDITNNLPNGAASLSSIAIHPTDDNKIWITFSGSSIGNKVYYSSDKGNTWINISVNLPNVAANTIVYQTNSPDGLYVGTDVGVFYTDSTLSNWQPFWNGLPNVVTTELEINYVSNKIRASTFGRGLWESDLYVPLQIPPTANFSADRIEICPGESVQFADASINAAPGWVWNFPGGTPASSTLANPVVTYAAAGNYDVQLIVNNAYGSDSLLQTTYIHAGYPIAQSVPFAEDFQNAFPAADWKVVNPDAGTTWSQNFNVGGYAASTASASINNYAYNSPGQSDILLTAAYDLTLITNPQLSFDLAYALFPGYVDTLKVFYTTDCGMTRNYIFNKGGDSLATASPIAAVFEPVASDWFTHNLSLDSNVANLTGVQFGFENINGYGNYLYLDNINIHQVFVGINEVNAQNEMVVFPNPVTSKIIIQIPHDSYNSTIDLSIYNAIGDKVMQTTMTSNDQFQLDVNTLSKGIYMLKVKSNDKTYLTKFTKM